MSAQPTLFEIAPLDKLKPASDNPRRSVGDVAELAASIQAVGILEPLVVTPQDGGYTVVAGSRRLAAARKAGLAEVPVVVCELSEEQRQEAMLIENTAGIERLGRGRRQPEHVDPKQHAKQPCHGVVGPLQLRPPVRAALLHETPRPIRCRRTRRRRRSA